MPSVNRKQEDEWFAKNERDLLKNLKRERERNQKALEEASHQEEAKRQRDLHWMKCPKCGSDLEEKDIEGIKVDQCRGCEGIYFDRNELDELLLKKRQECRTFMRRITGIFHS
jgi:uncharacterized protein